MNTTPPPPSTDLAQVRRYQARLWAAVQARDRSALRQTQQEVLASAFNPAEPPALRHALRGLVWHMAALLPRRGKYI